MIRSLATEFKAFALKGNMIDLAVAVVIGAAFGNVINSIVKNVLMPLISYVTPSTDFSKWQIGKVMFGNVLNDLLSFLIISLAVFIFIVKVIGFLTRKRNAEPPAEALPPVSKEELLLTEIRDLLKNRPL